MRCKYLIIGLTLATTIVTAYADLIINPNTPTGNVGASAGSSFASLVNNSGLSASVTTGMDTASALLILQSAATADTYVTGATTGDYFVNGGTVPVLTFNLGGTYNNINSIVIWNYTLAVNSVTEFSLSFYSDAAATAQIGSALNGLTLAVDSTNAQQVVFAGGVDFDGVQSARLTLTDNNGGNRVGLGEVRFSQVPEPSTVTLLGLSFCMVGLFRRRLMHSK